MSSIRAMAITLTLAVIAIGAAQPTQAVTVGWHYVNGAFNDNSIAAFEIAGAPGFAQVNWNNHVGAGQGTGTVPLNLVNNAGAASGVAVTNWTVSAPNSWHLGDHASADARLLDSFSNQQPSLTFTGLSSQFGSGYGVVVYYSNNEGPTTSNLAITGGTDDSVSRTITTGNTANVSFSSAGYKEGKDNNTATPTNYTIFTGLNDNSFTVAMTGGGNNGIAAVQIVSPDLLPAPPAKGDKIGWQWVTFDGVLAPAEVAGLPAVQQANWNTLGPRGQTNPTGSQGNLVDSNGLVTTLDLAYSAPIPSNPVFSNSWTMGSANATPNQKLLNSFLDPDPLLTLDQVPADFVAAGYSVVIYYNNNEGPSTSNVTIDGSIDDLITKQIRTGNTGFTRFDENGFILEDGVGPLDPSNVIIFAGLNDPAFTIKFTNANPTVGNNNGISGIQLVRNVIIIPEPATLGLLSLGLIAAGLRRRRAA